VDVVREDAAFADQSVVVVGVEVVERRRELRLDPGDLGEVLVEVDVNQAPWTSLASAAQDSSSASLQERENRGVTAYLVLPTPCQRPASARPSS